jgi:glucosylglycerate synthase
MKTENSTPAETSTIDQAPADLLVVGSAIPPEQLEAVLSNLETAFPVESVVFAAQSQPARNARANLRMISAPQSSAVWTLNPADFVNAYEIGRERQARAILLLGPGAHSLKPQALRELADSALSGSIDLAVPHYTLPAHAGLINSAILYPLTRALFATRTRFPLTIDIGLSIRMAERLVAAAKRFAAANQDGAILWPVNEAIVAGFAVDEIDVGPRDLPQPFDPDINTILAMVTGSIFADIEAKAAFWQRPRRLPPARGPVSETALTDGSSDIVRMVEAFRLANANLQEIWSLVLPPNSLLALKRISVVDASVFRIPENLWARIVYDFVIAYRLRTINRGHLLGALIPLYLAWVAGHLNVTESGTSSERHIEAVAAAFEAEKPYLVARWRWPDRFNS